MADKELKKLCDEWTDELDLELDELEEKRKKYVAVLKRLDINILELKQKIGFIERQKRLK